MNVVFVGPTLPDARNAADKSVLILPPAVQGDVLRAVEGGATAIGLIDGNFENVAPVWHKEILYALSLGVQVFGAASMGALRAVECAPFGMVGIGEIYRQYAEGARVDDADVALIHGPAELGYLPLTLPLVNVDATLKRLSQTQALDPALIASMGATASAMFYKERNWAGIVARVALPAGTDPARLTALLASEYVDQKGIDARHLLDALRHAPTQRTVASQGWKFNSTSMWKRLFGQPDASS
ncbi:MULTISPECIES: TfuA-like protein [Ensifer]|uniref:TfuA-like protein n=1 Tax=Ensifer adhaerens TaxID=106592 RepID=A0A9Q8YDF5_ENSAD|nr:MULTISPECIES: TfuA-like protein [Ensifer]ANK75322.1 antibiotic resistance protein [Ensifer adhaerens]KDP72705.1 antibiotic resistance protein [Ensifer adhaerens]KQZ41127.1 antibiotic resistance protein [Ensifer sp. Root558]MBD9497115.1 antibiotic resistance protein [Ensifer sp. ENS01]MCY1739392.1 TfuA-like protein [Ensifer sp. SL37]